MKYFRSLFITMVTMLVSMAVGLPLSSKQKVVSNRHINVPAVLWSQIVSLPTLTLRRYQAGLPPKRSLQTVDALLNIPLHVLCRAGRAVRERRMRNICPEILNRSTIDAEMPRDLPKRRTQAVSLH